MSGAAAPRVPALPEFGEVASKLAAIVARLDGPGNPFREALLRVSAHLAPASRILTAARSELGLLTAALLRDGTPFDEPESWITFACVVLVTAEQARLAGGLTAAPAGARPS